jgi:UDP-N-acetylmuramate dehydrogenase
MNPLPPGVGDILRGRLRGEVLENEPLENRTTYRIGGLARFLVCPQDLEDLKVLNQIIRDLRLPRFVLGGGSNVLVSDHGFQGIVIHLHHFNRLEIEEERVSAGAGLQLDGLVVECLRRSLAGLEKLSGIPGTLGGALRMNAGAFDAEISNYLCTVECLDFLGSYRVLNKQEVQFHYRQAPAIRDTYILGATFQFTRNDVEELFRIRETTLARRYEKQPWQYPSAGSVFKRPAGYYTGKLIEDLGLKGRRSGRAQISPKHAGIIINLGGATADDVLQLIHLARNEVHRAYGIDLELEQELVGF